MKRKTPRQRDFENFGLLEIFLTAGFILAVVGILYVVSIAQKLKP